MSRSRNFFQVVERRQSVRKFTDEPVEETAVQAILSAVNRAPSAGNLQAYQITVVRKARAKARLAAAAGDQACVREAPIVLVFCAHPVRSATRYGSRGAELYCVQDATIACAYAQLAATALGLASVWIGAVFEPELIQQTLGLDHGLWPLALLPVGHPAETPPRTTRRPLHELVWDG